MKYRYFGARCIISCFCRQQHDERYSYQLFEMGELVNIRWNAWRKHLANKFVFYHHVAVYLVWHPATPWVQISQLSSPDEDCILQAIKSPQLLGQSHEQMVCFAIPVRVSKRRPQTNKSSTRCALKRQACRRQVVLESYSRHALAV